MIVQDVMTYEQAEQSFRPHSNSRFESYVGWVKYFHLGSLNDLPACRVDTCYVHPDMHNNINAAQAVAQMIEAFQGQSAMLIHPPGYKRLKGDRDMTAMYVLAENKDQLCEAVKLFPTLGTSMIVCNRIRSDYK